MALLSFRDPHRYLRFLPVAYNRPYIIEENGRSFIINLKLNHVIFINDFQSPTIHENVMNVYQQSVLKSGIYFILHIFTTLPIHILWRLL